MAEFVREYVSALTARELVNREEIVEAIRKAIFEAGDETRVLLITAEGGMGKTFLLRKILEKCRPDGEWSSLGPLIVPPQAGRDLVDFYHIHTHGIEGFTQEVWKALGGDDSGMSEYSRALNDFQDKKFHFADLHREISRAREELGTAFLEDLKCLTNERRLVLALDTCEKLLYEVGEIERALNLRPEETGILSWLTEHLLPEVGNTVFLLAGRPETDVEILRQDLAERLGTKFIHLQFKGFNKPEEGVAYFNAVAEAVKATGQADIANRITAIPEDRRKVIWHYTEGKPILLSLVIDHVITADRLVPDLTDSWQDASARSDGELDNIRQRLAEALVQGIQERGLPEDEAIRALALARKGLTADMLAKMVGTSEDNARALLEKVKNLSFVKVLGDRFFLHDEMYLMFQQHVLSKMPAWRDRAYRGILEYYAGEIAKARERVQGILDEADTRRSQARAEAWGADAVPLTAPKDLPEAQAQLHTLLIEDMYYRWRLKAHEGFKAWEAYYRETYWANDVSVALELDDEVRAFLREESETQDFKGLTRPEVELTMVVHRLQRMLLRGEREEAIGFAQYARGTCSGLPPFACTLVRAQLDTVEGEALAYLGQNLAHAEELLEGAVKELKNPREQESPFDEWRRKVALAEALNVQGYLYRTIGRYKKSVDTYQETLALWRLLTERENVLSVKRSLQAQYANTLNNMAWALAWTGQTRRALRLCNDALELRSRLGPQGPTAYSLNTFGLIQTKADQPHRAEKMCTRALEIFSRLDQPRGRGFARTALSEALRRQAALGFMYPLPEARRLLERSVEHAEDAVEIFDGLQERPQLIQALIELGCAHRDWARLLKEGNADEAQWRSHVSEGEEALKRAMGEVGKEENLSHMRVDAQVNLAWLYYYAGDAQLAETEAISAQKEVPETHHFKSEIGAPRLNEIQRTFLLVQLAKAELLLGQILLDKGDLESAGECFTLALAYDELFATPPEFQERVKEEPTLREIFSPDFRDLRQAKDRIYDQVKGFSQEQFSRLYAGIRKAEKEYKLASPTALEYFLWKNFGKPDKAQ